MSVGLDRDVRELRGAVTERPNPHELAALASRLVRGRVAHDALRIIASHPNLALEIGAFSLWHGYEAGLGQALLRQQYQGDDPWSPHRLIQLGVPGAVVTGSDEIGEALDQGGAGSELRLLLRDGRGVWGMLALLRAAGGTQFSPADVRVLVEIAPELAAAARTLVTGQPLHPTTPVLAPGVIVLDRNHRMIAITPQAQQWLGMMGNPERHGPPEWTVDPFNLGLSLAVRRHAQDRSAPVPQVCAPPLCFGRWVSVRGQPLDGDGAGEIAITIQAAGREALLPFCEWYGITAREREVIEQLYTGAAVKHIARDLRVSPHTVNTHLKSVYRKTGAESRGELIAAISG